MIDLLNDELSLIIEPIKEEKSAVVDEWREVGNKNTKVKFNNEQ